MATRHLLKLIGVLPIGGKAHKALAIQKKLRKLRRPSGSVFKWRRPTKKLRIQNIFQKDSYDLYPKVLAYKYALLPGRGIHL